MKLRNKKTGEIGEIGYIGSSSGKLTVSPINRVACEEIASYNSLAELNEEWEDYEEPKDYWYIDADGEVICEPSDNKCKFDNNCREIGNYFSSQEEAEKAVEKLKAWKRLKDKGFRFNGKEVFSEGLLEIDGVLPALKGADNAERLKIVDDLELLFGGEE